MSIKDLKGMDFGRLHVKDFAYTKDGNAYWICDCKCGTKDIVVRGSDLTKRFKQSCNCLHKEIAKKNGTKNFETAKKYMNVQGTDINKIISGERSDNKSGTKGVSYVKRSKSWVARICFKGKSYYLLQSKNKEEAIMARKKAEEKIFGNFLEWYAKEYPEQWERLNKKKSKKDCD